jgi:hypothetical protein
LSLGQVRLHDAVDHALDRCCLAARIGTGSGGWLLRGNLHRHQQNRDCDNQPKTSGDAMHNLFSRQLSASENDDL